MQKLTKEIFLKKAQAAHNGFYDYSSIEYLNSKTKVKLICPVHGIFYQRPSNHLLGRGCQKCGGTLLLDSKEFINKAKERHGNKYGYALVDYKNSKTKVIIVCSQHGKFLQTPDGHLQGRGCPKCGRSYPLDTITFIEKSKILHGNKYNYSLVNYKTNNRRVKIICLKHGVFLQSAINHLQGKGCWRCSYVTRSKNLALGKSEFLKRAKILHNNTYDYSLVDYKNANTPVIIICPRHGKYNQRPSVHLRPGGCRKCAVEKTKLQLTKTTSEFVAQAQKVHHHKYNYSEVDYTSARKKVIIICSIHGRFKQYPYSHLIGYGCDKCADIIRADKKKLSSEEFLQRAKEIHGNKYGYSDVKYVNMHTKIKIICNVHGLFYQLPYNHLIGMGCPGCANSGIDMTGPGVLYYLRIITPMGNFWKIGVTNRSIKKRFMSDMKNITIVKNWHFDRIIDGFNIEQKILKDFAKYRYKGNHELLSRGGNTEIFIKDVLGIDN